MWLIFALAAAIAPIGLLLFSRVIRVPEAGRRVEALIRSGGTPLDERFSLAPAFKPVFAIRRPTFYSRDTPLGRLKSGAVQSWLTSFHD